MSVRRFVEEIMDKEGSEIAATKHARAFMMAEQNFLHEHNPAKSYLQSNVNRTGTLSGVFGMAIGLGTYKLLKRRISSRLLKSSVSAFTFYLGTIGVGASMQTGVFEAMAGLRGSQFGHFPIELRSILFMDDPTHKLFQEMPDLVPTKEDVDLTFDLIALREHQISEFAKRPVSLRDNPREFIRLAREVGPLHTPGSVPEPKKIYYEEGKEPDDIATYIDPSEYEKRKDEMEGADPRRMRRILSDMKERLSNPRENPFGASLYERLTSKPNAETEPTAEQEQNGSNAGVEG